MKIVKEKILKPKLKQSETVIIKRSKINFAPYNPRKKNPKVVKELKDNFKRVGFLGGIQWNITTGNLIGGHKRLEALDLIYNYDGSKEKDYDIKVEKIELDLQTEKEQNIFLNNKRMQGETDFELLAEILHEINFENAGLDEYDINLVESLVPDFNFGSNKEIIKESEKLKNEVKNNKEKIKSLKKNTSNINSENHQPFYFTVTFKSAMDKAEFLEGIGINGDEIFITSKRFLNKLYEK